VWDGKSGTAPQEAGQGLFNEYKAVRMPLLCGISRQPVLISWLILKGRLYLVLDGANGLEAVDR